MTTNTTPRTDAFYESVHSDCVGIEFARQLERDLAAAQEERAKSDYATRRAVERAERAESALARVTEERERAVNDAERYEARLFKLGAMDEAPCFKCGYNGPGYYHASTHACAKMHHAAIAAREKP